MIFNLLPEDFKETIDNSVLPVLIEFYTTTCPYCKRAEFVLNKISDKYSSKIRFLKINIENCFELIKKYDIATLPSIKLFCEGLNIADYKGELRESCFENFLNDFLNSFS